MIEANDPIAWDIKSLRTRYFPKSQIAQGLVNMAPWASLGLILLYLLILPMELIVRPGIRIELPVAPLRGGASYGPTAVVLSMEGSERGVRKEIIFFDDQPYPADEPQRVKALGAALDAAAKAHPDLVLTIEADRRVRHGTIVDLYNLAMDAGIRSINVATRQEGGKGVPPE